MEDFSQEMQRRLRAIIDPRGDRPPLAVSTEVMQIAEVLLWVIEAVCSADKKLLDNSSTAAVASATATGEEHEHSSEDPEADADRRRRRRAQVPL
jgi:hypothetical protein